MLKNSRNADGQELSQCPGVIPSTQESSEYSDRLPFHLPLASTGQELARCGGDSAKLLAVGQAELLANEYCIPAPLTPKIPPKCISKPRQQRLNEPKRLALDDTAS